jgi:hypothetical protein
VPCAPNLPNRVVDVIAERVSALIAVEERREHAKRKRSRRKQRVSIQRTNDEIAEFDGYRVLLGELKVFFDAGRLMTRGNAPVDPGCLIKFLSRPGRLLERQHSGNVN